MIASGTVEGVPELARCRLAVQDFLMTDDHDDQKGGEGTRQEPRLPKAAPSTGPRPLGEPGSAPAPLRPSAAMRTYLRPARLNASNPPADQPTSKSLTEHEQHRGKPEIVRPAPTGRGETPVRPPVSQTRQTDDVSGETARVSPPPPPLPKSVPLNENRESPADRKQAPHVRMSRPVGEEKRPTSDTREKPTIPAMESPAPRTPPNVSHPVPVQQETAKTAKRKTGLAAKLFGRRRKTEVKQDPAESTERRTAARRAADENPERAKLPPIDANVETLSPRPAAIKPQPRLVLENVGLEIRSLGKHFKKRPVLRDVSLRVQRGEAVGLLGPNGAGKTTCFYIVTGLIPADYGEIFLDGQDITSLPMYRRARMGIGYLPQEASIFRGLTVEQNIRAVLELVEKNLERRETALESLLAEFSISHLRRTPAIALSGGERRRLEIARALASQPNFILLDEPLAGIDPIAVRDIRDLVSHLKDRGIGVLITDHNVRETLEVVDRAYILHDGNVLMEGPPEEIVSNQEVRRVYLGDRFTL